MTKVIPSGLSTKPPANKLVDVRITAGFRIVGSLSSSIQLVSQTRLYSQSSLQTKRTSSIKFEPKNELNRLFRTLYHRDGLNDERLLRHIATLFVRRRKVGETRVRIVTMEGGKAPLYTSSTRPVVVG